MKYLVFSEQEPKTGKFSRWNCNVLTSSGEWKWSISEEPFDAFVTDNLIFASKVATMMGGHYVDANELFDKEILKEL